jgi:hypothetical protein
VIPYRRQSNVGWNRENYYNRHSSEGWNPGSFFIEKLLIYCNMLIIAFAKPIGLIDFVDWIPDQVRNDVVDIFHVKRCKKHLLSPHPLKTTKGLPRLEVLLSSIF